MRYLAYHEKLSRGSFGFPLELYIIDSNHTRYEMPYHWHLECEMLLVLEGEFALSLDGKQLLLSENQSAFIPSGAIHGGEPKNCKYLCIVFDLEKFLEYSSKGINKYSNIFNNLSCINNHFRGDSTCGEIILNLFQVIMEKAPGYEFITNGLMLQFIGTVIAQNLFSENLENDSTTRHSAQVKDVLSFIRGNYNKPIGLEDLAAKSGLNSHYFCKIFKKLVGQTPIEYLNYYRIECASEMLLLEKESITDISLSCGFNDLSYFNRLFKKHKGVSPSNFRKLNLIK